MDNRQQIHLENLSLRYRGIETSALKHISVDAEFGHVIGIIGNHHAGKTSLCRVLAGIVPTIISGDVTEPFKLDHYRQIWIGRSIISKPVLCCRIRLVN